MMFAAQRDIYSKLNLPKPGVAKFDTAGWEID